MGIANALNAHQAGVQYQNASGVWSGIATSTANQILLSGSSTTPTWSTSTYPSTNAANTLLYASSVNTMAALATANDGVLITSNSGIPSWLANSGTAGFVLTANTAAPPSWKVLPNSSISITGDSGGALTGNSFTFTGGTTGLTFSGSTSTETLTGTLSLANGGTSASLTASIGGIFYSTASAAAILAGTATAGQLLRSGASLAPSWSTTTYPATNSINTLLYASSANVMGALATSNDGVLITSATGVPSWLAAGTTGQVLIATTSNPASWATLSSLAVTSITATAPITASASTGAVTIALTTPLAVTFGGTGTATAFTAGSVIFAGTSGVYNQNNANFFWDNTNHRLGIIDSSPGANLSIVGNAQIGFSSGTTAPSNGLAVSGQTLIGTTVTASNGYLVVRPTLTGTSTLTNAVFINPTFTSSGAVQSYTNFFATGTFTPPIGATYTTADGMVLSPTFSSTTSGAITLAHGISITPTINMTSTGQLTTFYAYYTAASIPAGTITTFCSLYLTTPSIGGAITNYYTAILGTSNTERVGIGITTPVNTLDINGNLAIGTFAGTSSATNGLIVSGDAGFGISNPNATVHIGRATVTASGISPYLQVDQAADTNQSASIESPTVYLNFAKASRQWQGGALTIQRYLYVGQPTITFNGTSTVTDAASLGIVGGVAKGTNATVTNSHGLLISSANVAAVMNSYGLSVNAQTGGTNNYCAQFLGGNVGIGTSSPVASALLAISSTTQGFLPPIMTTTQQNAISSPANGLTLYNSTDNVITSYNSTVAIFYSGFLQTSAAFAPVLSATGNAIQNSGVSGQNGWSCTSNGSTSENISSFANGFGISIQPTSAPSTGGYIEWNAGTGFVNGRYEVDYSILFAQDRGIFSTTEVTSSTTIRGNTDMYEPTSAGAQCFFSDQFIWTQGTGSNMIIRWTITGKDSSSSNFFILMSNAVEIKRVG